MIDHKFCNHKTVILPDNIFHYKISEFGKKLTVREVLDKWQNDIHFCENYQRLIHLCPFEKLYWEHPPWTIDSLDDEYEFVLIKNSTSNPLPPDRKSFASKFDADNLVVTFPNLGGDAELIVPKPITGEEDYAHLANFIRTAPAYQLFEFWKLVGQTTLIEIQESKRWLSTCGMGVYWLHVRLDTRPKYYKYKPYRTA